MLRARPVENSDVGAATTGTSYLRLLPSGFTRFDPWGWFIPWNFFSPAWWLEAEEVLHEAYCSVQWEKGKKTKPLVARTAREEQSVMENYSILRRICSLQAPLVLWAFMKTCISACR